MVKKKEPIPLDTILNFSKVSETAHDFYSFKNYVIESLYDLQQENNATELGNEVTDELTPYVALLNPAYEDNFQISAMGLLYPTKRQLQDYLRKVDRYVKPKNNDNFLYQLEVLAGAYLSLELKREGNVSFDATEYVFQDRLSVTPSLIKQCRKQLGKLPTSPFMDRLLTVLLFYILVEKKFDIQQVRAKQQKSTTSLRSIQQFTSAYLAYKQAKWQEIQPNSKEARKNSVPTEEDIFLSAGMALGLILNPDVAALL